MVSLEHDVSHDQSIFSKNASRFSCDETSSDYLYIMVFRLMCLVSEPVQLILEYCIFEISVYVKQEAQERYDIFLRRWVESDSKVK